MAAIESVNGGLRRPTPKQERQIISMLETVYDDENQCYKGSDTDKTVAEVLEDGILPGWVAEQREKLFGPDGGNESMKDLQKDLAAWLKQADESQAACEAFIARISEERQTVHKFQDRLAKIAIAVGPKANT